MIVERRHRRGDGFVLITLGLPDEQKIALWLIGCLREQGEKGSSQCDEQAKPRIENGERQAEMGGTGDSPVPRGDSPHGMTSEPAISKGATASRSSGGL